MAGLKGIEAIWCWIRHWLGRLWPATSRTAASGSARLAAVASPSPEPSPPPRLQLLTMFDPPRTPEPLNAVVQEHLLGRDGLLTTCWKCTLTINGEARIFLLQTVADLTTSPVRVVQRSLRPAPEHHPDDAPQHSKEDQVHER